MMQTRMDATACRAARRADRASGRRLRLGLAGAALAALTVGVLPTGAALAAAVPGTHQALAAAASRSDAPAGNPAYAARGAPPARSATAGNRRGHAAVPRLGPRVSRGVRAACAPARPRFARCLALVRTDIRARSGLQAAGAPIGYGPADLRNAYNLPSVTAGSGQTVAIVDAFDDPAAAANLAVYRAQYGLPPCTAASGCFRKVAQDGSSNYPPPDATGQWEFEESLDVDMVSAICPNCHILLVEARNNSLPNLGAAVDEAVRLGAKYVSNSYGGAEHGTELAWDQRYYQHPGVAVTASAGDSGYGVLYPAASQYVTAVGGTTLTRDPRVPRGWTETVWGSRAGGEGTGSGCSAYEPKPAWQADQGCPARTVADVSADANPGTGVAAYDTYQANGWQVIGGTSVSSPIIASAFALAGPPIAGTYPSSYPYRDASALNDVTSGANGTCHPAYLCTAGPGYDGPTGLGTPHGVAALRTGPHGTISGTVTSAVTGAPLTGAWITAGAFSAVSDATGRYVLVVPPGTYRVAGTDFGYRTRAADGVRVAQGQTVTENFALGTVPKVILTGSVTDGSGHGWPLYASVSVPGTPASTYADPATGRYELTLPDHAAYKVQVIPQYPGYLPAHRSVRIGTSGVRQSFRLAADDTACTKAPGYRFNGPLERFNSGIATPPGWSVVTPQGTTPWAFTNGNLGNLTGGTGSFANVYFGSTVPEGSADHTNLISPAVNMTADRQPILRFDQALNEQPAERVEIDLSIDGGHTWSAIWKHSGPSISGPDTRTFALPAAAGQPDVRVRFQFIDTSVREFSDFWELDNIYLGNLPCAPIPGGLVTGQVTDGNTGVRLDGATVTSASDPREHAVTRPTPADPRLGGGFYFLFSRAIGDQRFTAATARYAAGAATENVRPNRVTTASFALRAGRLSVTPSALSVTERMGQATTEPLTFTNTGQAPVTVRLSQRPGQVTVLGGPSSAAGPPAVRVHGTFSPLAAAAMPGAGRPATHGRAGGGPAPASGIVPGPPWMSLRHYPVSIMDNGVATDTSTGEVYSVGGYDGGLLRSGYVYNPASQAWAALPDMRYRRDDPQAAFIGGKLYVVGGWSPQGPPVAALEVYDPAAHRWFAGARIPAPVAGAAVAVDDGNMYVIGGCGQHTCGRKTVQIYHPSTNSWSTGTAYPSPVAWESCGAIKASIYCAGGITSNYTDTAAAYVYRPAAGTWSAITPLPTEWWAAGYTATSGRLLISGGVIGGGAGAAQVLTNLGYAYDPASATWAPLPNSSVTTYRGGSACGFYRIGGSDAPSPDPRDWAVQLTSYAGCSFAHVPWLAESQARFTLRPGESLRVDVTLNAGSHAVTQPGTYASALVIGQNTPYRVPQVGVRMRVSPPPSWGAITGRVTGRACHRPAAPLWGASVKIGTENATYPLTTPSDGRYLLWLDVRDNPLRLTAAKPGWQSEASTARIKPMRTTTVNFKLSPDKFCT